MLWKRLAGPITVALVSVTLTAGCAVGVIRPPLTRVETVRPALADPACLPGPWKAWLLDLLRAYEDNCVTLAVLRGEVPRCEVR